MLDESLCHFFSKCHMWGHEADVEPGDLSSYIVPGGQGRGQCTSPRGALHRWH